MKLNSKSGFSLVELMVVVAIIGILVTIAAPNLTKFQAKSKQANARTELSGIYSAEKSFYTEYGTYHGILPYVGYVPDGYRIDDSSGCPAGSASNVRYYNVGFQTPGIVAVPPGGAPINCSNVINYAATTHSQPLPQTAASVANTTSATAFQAVALGRINGPRDDIWRINQDKVLENTRSGL